MRLRLLAAAAAACVLATPLTRVGAPLAAGPTRVWPVGDSITLGTSWPQNTPGGFRAELDGILGRDGYAHTFVGTTTANSSPTLDADHASAHDGHGGYRIDQVLRDLAGLAHGDTDDGGHWLTGTRERQGVAPDAAIIDLGTNDIVQHWDPRRFPTRSGRADYTKASQRRQFVADMTTRLQTLLETIHALRPQCLLIVATAIPIDVHPFDAVTADYAASVRRLVGGLRHDRYPVALADAYAAFTTESLAGASVVPGLLSKDGVHPTAAGYTVMARIFAATLESS